MAEPRPVGPSRVGIATVAGLALFGLAFLLGLIWLTKGKMRAPPPETRTEPAERR